MSPGRYRGLLPGARSMILGGSGMGKTVQAVNAMAVTNTVNVDSGLIIAQTPEVERAREGSRAGLLRVFG